MDSRQSLIDSLRRQMQQVQADGTPSRAAGKPTACDGLDAIAWGAAQRYPAYAKEDAGDGVASTHDPYDDAEAAFEKVKRIAVRQEHSHEKMRAKLARSGYTPQATQTAIERAERCGLIDDRRYAEVLIRSRLAQGKGMQGIALEARDLRIAPHELESLLDEYAREQPPELERALQLLSIRPTRAKNLRASAYRKLVQKGYSSSVASSASRLWCEEQESRAS